MGEKKKKKKKKKRFFSYGNYWAYYGSTYRDTAADPRVQMITGSMLEGKRVLDVGCNAGCISVAVAAATGVKSMTGIDLDPQLVGKARRHLAAQMEEGKVGAEVGARISFACADIMAVGAEAPLPSLLCPDAVVVEGRGKSGKIKSQDLNLSRQVVKTSRYDAIMALSVSKWIHVHHGDDGLLSFFRLIYQMLDGPGSIFLFEPQPWSSYRKAKRNIKSLSSVLPLLKIKPDDFPSVLTSPAVGFSSCVLLNAAPSSSPSSPSSPSSSSSSSSVLPPLTPGFDRPLYLLTK